VSFPESRRGGRWCVERRYHACTPRRDRRMCE
jgi:hypothetical protein